MDTTEFIKFQFYLSSIKSSAGVSGVGNPTAFQFYLSSIKSPDSANSLCLSSVVSILP